MRRFQCFVDLFLTMIRSHADPFQAVELPEIIEEYLHQGTATSIALNRKGTLLAGA